MEQLTVSAQSFSMQVKFHINYLISLLISGFFPIQFNFQFSLTRRDTQGHLLSSFLSGTFMNHRSAGEGAGYFFNSSLLRPASRTLRHQTGDYCRKLTSVHSQQLDSNRGPLVFKCKLLTTTLCVLNLGIFRPLLKIYDQTFYNNSSQLLNIFFNKIHHRSLTE